MGSGLHLSLLNQSVPFRIAILAGIFKGFLGFTLIKNYMKILAEMHSRETLVALGNASGRSRA